MPHNTATDWDDDEADDFDEFSEELDEDEPTISCPYCRAEIHEDAQRCPDCQQYISREDAPPAVKPWWILLGVAAVLYIVFRWTAG